MYNDELIKFEVYTNYLCGLDYFIKKRYPSCEIIAALLPESPQNDVFDLDKVRRFLFNSWNSERILCFPGEIEEQGFYLKFANHWSPVLAYYSIFLAFQGLFLSQGKRPVLQHDIFLSTLSSCIKKNTLALQFPWNLLCTGSTYYNLESYNFNVVGSDVKCFSPLSNYSRENEAVFMAKLLKTTRTKQEEYREEQYRKRKEFLNKDGTPKMKFNKRTKLAINERIHPTSVFDFLYRLRLRSNYEDADIFFLGERDNTSITNYFRAILGITNHTLFSVETLIKRNIGKKNFYLIIDSFKSNSPVMKSGIFVRREFH